MNKFNKSKLDISPAMSRWVKRRTTTKESSDDVSCEEQSAEIVITKIAKDGKRKADAVESEDDEEVQVTKVTKDSIKKRKVPDEVRIVKVSPPKKDRYKHMTKKELFGDENEGFETDPEKVDYYVIHSNCRRDGGNVLTYVPGYTALWRCPQYINTLHQTLYYEIKVWCKEVRKFVHRLDNEWEEDTAFDTEAEKKQKEHILESVTRMETTVLKNVLKINSVLIHTLCFHSIMMVFPGCGKTLSKLVKYMCRSKSYHIRYFPVVDNTQAANKDCSFDIGTLLSIGHEWHFGQWDDKAITEE